MVCCKPFTGVFVEDINGYPVTKAPGNGISKNLLFDKSYIDRTVKQLHSRMSGHPEYFYKIIPNDEIDEY